MFDRESHYSNKTVKQIQSEIKQFNDAIIKFDSSDTTIKCPSWFNDHIQYLKMKLAERIGKK